MNFKKCSALLLLSITFIFSSLPAIAEVTVSDAWVRMLPPMSKMTAAYMNIQSNQEDRLISASSDIAKMIEIHQSKMTDGVMSMQEIDSLVLPKDTLVELKPQGYHLMIMGLVKPLAESESYSFTLEFEKAGKVSIEVPVRNP